MGLLTLLADLSKQANKALQFYSPSGALSGEATFAILAWLLSWILLAKLWRYESPRQGIVLASAYGLLFSGLLMTFPPFLHLLHR